MKSIAVKDVMTSLAVQYAVLEGIAVLQDDLREGGSLSIWNYIALSAYSEEVCLMSDVEVDMPGNEIGFQDEVLAHIIVGRNR